MTLILNLIWFVLGGFVTGLGWLLAALVMAVSLVGLPFVPSALRIASFSAWPFGRQVVPRRLVTGREDIGTGAIGFLGNVLWVVLAGWWLALAHLGLAVSFGVTIIGIPFAWQHLKLAVLSFAPIGQEIVET